MRLHVIGGQLAAVIVCVSCAEAVAASPQASTRADASMPPAIAPTTAPVIYGPPPPTPPDVIRRDAQGRATIRAVRVSQPVVLDGKLDEGVYRTVPSISEFVQGVPDNGQPSSQRTEAWVLFDDDNIYVSGRCW